MNTTDMTTVPNRSHTVITHPEAKHLGGNQYGGDTRTQYPHLWRWLVQQYGIESVFDVGCGEGYAIEEFVKLGCSVIGLDGLPHNALQASKYAPCILHDLTKGPVTTVNADLVWCCEVVEHVDEKHIDFLLDTLATGRVLAMTHALPGQAGWHHVNCQESEYWIERLRTRGYTLDGEATDESQQYAGYYWSQSGLIFTR